MGMTGYRLDAALARLRAMAYRLGGLKIGAGVKIHAGVRLRCAAGHARLGDRVEIYRGVQILCTAGGSVEIGAHSHIAPLGHLLIGGSSLMVGSRVAMGPQVAIFCESNGTAWGRPFVDQLVRAPVVIGSNVFLGARVTVLPGAVIEDDVVVAAHAVVRGTLRSGFVYGGVPAREIKALSPERPG